MFYFFRRYLRTNKAVTSWTKRSTFRTLYGATSEIIHLLCTVTFVMNIYVMIVRLNTLQINPKTTRWLTFHLKGGAIYFFPECTRHSKKTCERHCEQCGIPLCSQCISSDQHSNHKNIDILENLEKKKEDIKSDLQELVASISPRYQSIAGGFFNQIAYLHENCEKISLALDKQGEDWHREIDNIVKELKSNISDIKCKQLTFFSVKVVEINETTSEIDIEIANLKKLVNSKVVSRVSAYKSRTSELRNLPYKFRISLPNFTPYKIDKEQIYQQFVTCHYVLLIKKHKSLLK